jgi:hypothetical protein
VLFWLIKKVCILKRRKGPARDNGKVPPGTDGTEGQVKFLGCKIIKKKRSARLRSNTETLVSGKGPARLRSNTERAKLGTLRLPGGSIVPSGTFGSVLLRRERAKLFLFHCVASLAGPRVANATLLRGRSRQGCNSQVAQQYGTKKASLSSNILHPWRDLDT